MLYPIVETFYSIQGEGLFQGRSAYFVRLWGCPVKCDWCDTKLSWQNPPTRKMSVEEILEDAKSFNANLAIITGGEPCMHNLLALVKAFKNAGVEVNLETSGVIEVQEELFQLLDWVALSPKLFQEPLMQTLERADELKIILSEPTEFEKYAKFFDYAKNAKAIWLHPEWSRHQDKKLLAAICDFVKKSADTRLRAGWQLHKNYFVR